MYGSIYQDIDSFPSKWRLKIDTGHVIEPLVAPDDTLRATEVTVCDR